MTTFLFVSDPDNDHEAAQDVCIWTCSSTTEAGDQILVYVKTIGIQFEWVALSEAKHTGYRQYECIVEYVRTFNPPLSLDEICKRIAPHEWKAPHLNFRGYTSIQVPEEMVKPLLAKQSSYREVDINPKSTKTHYNRGNAYADFGESGKALQFYNQAIRLDPNFADALGNRGMAYAAQGKFALALADCNKAIQLNPNNTVLYFFRGSVYFQQKKFAQAIADINKVIQKFPNEEPLLYAMRGMAFADQGDSKRAITDYSKAISLDPKNAVAHYSLATIYADRGDKQQEAISHFQRALKYEFDPYWQEQIEQRLRQLGATPPQRKRVATSKAAKTRPKTKQSIQTAPPRPEDFGLSRIEKLVRIGADFDIVLEANYEPQETTQNSTTPPDDFVDCPYCSAKLKAKNLDKHIKKVHKKE